MLESETNIDIGTTIGGRSYASMSTTTPDVENNSPELSEGITGFPIWNLGGEWSFADWIVGRMGYMAYWKCLQ